MARTRSPSGSSPTTFPILIICKFEFESRVSSGRRGKRANNAFNPFSSASFRPRPLRMIEEERVCVCVGGGLSSSDTHIGLSLHRTATHCIALQHTASHCNTLHRTATHCIALQHTALQALCSVMQCVAVCCSVLQCVAVCCSAMQCVAVRCNVL